ncbi:MAG: nucleoside-triphosphatase, partial [Anaerolineae bacterium]|nr:nucleoside-triphosphatase [Anaerolineae bacterium]
GVPVGRYLFDPDALAWGTEVLARSTPCDLLVLDELGPLEMAGGGWAVGIDVLREGHFLLALVVVRPEMVTEALERFPDAWVVEVTPQNRDGLPAWLAGLLPPRRCSAP